ncbi:IMPACT family protein [Tessaracoccus defluvii]|uniref:YigZ family protein n=1 Tax=Tessaracoccus defluvii TaxID=1285901 RepID=A0A7H0H9M4_9ACTN|nr:YigZ family protein [Tessaracoccus defluvii]QNP57240.1 YigZ family protein [Tessaracoccus defluvii]
MSDRFLTINAAPGEGADVELEIRRSRFLTRIRRVTTEDEARSVIDERRATLFDARHHCSAFILGPDARTARSSDDGEPAGTAGIPMFTALQRNGLTDVVAVVTRYFGGVKLGAGGLVRAYTDAVAQAMDAAGTREVRLSRILQVDVDFASAGALEDQLRGLVLPSGARVVVDGVDWSDRAHIRVAIPTDSVAEFDVALATLSAGAVVAEPVAERWTDYVSGMV